jgi:predicted flavoprotein YhiN
MSKKRLVVIGGDAAGMSAAAQAKRLDKGLAVIAFEKGPHTSYSA